jgi:hypothetical protein
VRIIEPPASDKANKAKRLLESIDALSLACQQAALRAKEFVEAVLAEEKNGSEGKRPAPDGRQSNPPVS